MKLDDTNIISDDDFLKDIFNQTKEEPKEDERELSEVEKILQGEVTSNDVPKDQNDNEEPEEENSNQLSEAEILKEEKKSSRFGVKDTVSTLIENGIWVDMPIKYGDKEYDNIEDLIEKEKPSKELFELLSLAQKKYRDDQLNDSYVKIGDKSTTKAKLVNAILNDTDYNDLLKYNQDVVEPLQKINFSTIQRGDEIAEAFVRQCLVDIDNYHPSSINAVIEDLKKNFQIIDKAEEYQKITIDNFNYEIERRNNEKAELVRKYKEQEKEQMKSLRDELKNQNLNDSISSKILKLRFTKDPQSDRYHYQDLIEDKIKDKAFEARLMHFLLDDKDFIEKEKSKVKMETSKTFMELVHTTPKSSSSTATKKSGNLQTEDEDFFREIGLIRD